jgi:integrase
LFSGNNSSYRLSNNLRRRVFYPCLEKAGLRRVRIHDLRHTYASLLIQQGESLAYIRDQLGHHSIQVTVDIYGHLVPGGNQAAVDRLDDAPIRNQLKGTELTIGLTL